MTQMHRFFLLPEHKGLSCVVSISF